MEKPLFAPLGLRPVCVISLPCPTCGSELAFLEQYQRHYCYTCGNYAPEGYGDRGAKICPTCRGILSYVAQYDRQYCYRCNAYPADDAVLQSLEATMPVDIRPAPEASEPSIAVTEPEKTEVAEKPVEVERTVNPEKTAEPSVEPLVTVARAPATPIPQPEEIVEVDPPQSEATEPRPRPPIVRLKVFQAKKPALMDLCKAYNLDPTGTKEQLRERLLSYLDTLEGEEAEVEQSVEEPESTAEPAPTEPAGEVERESWPTSREIVEAQPVEEEPARGEPTAASPSAVTPEVIETGPLQESVVERIDTPVLVSVTESQPEVSAAPEFEPSRALHPCPTCGRELTYIARYRRWYCYHCRAYAPVSQSKFACPNCGAALRWIGQYERWWCDSCRRYAPADLPKPESAAVATATPAEVVKPVSYATAYPTSTITHRHRSPGSGIGLVGFGIILFVLYELLVDLPGVLSYTTGIAVAPDFAFGLRFFAFDVVLKKHQGQPLVKVYTSGNFFDDHEVSPDVRERILKELGDRCDKVIVETLAHLLRRDQLEHAMRFVGELEIALGLESTNENVLKYAVNKVWGLKEHARAASLAHELGATVKTYLLIKPPFLTEREAIEDAVRSGHEADPYSDTVSFNPVNVQSRTIVDRLFRRGEYRPPWLWSVVEVLERTRDLNAHVKSHPTAGGMVRGAHNCGTCDRRVVNAIEEFSLGLRDDFADLSCPCQDVWRTYYEAQPFMLTSSDPLAVLEA